MKKSLKITFLCIFYLVLFVLLLIFDNIVRGHFIQKNRFQVYIESRDCDKVKLLSRDGKFLRVLSPEYTKEDINKLIDDGLLYKFHINIKTLEKRGCEFSVFHSEVHKYVVTINCHHLSSDYLYQPIFANLNDMERFIKKAFF